MNNILLRLVLVWLAGVALTWGIVENPHFDYAMIMHDCLRYAAGDVMFRDFQWQYPPLPLWVFGTAVRWSPTTPLWTVQFLSALVAAGLLSASYRLGRLFFNERIAALAAVASYGMLFIQSAASGPLFIGYGIMYLGNMIFLWFTVCLCRVGVRSGRISWGYAFFTGCIGGLCLLAKHELVAGVIAAMTGLWLFQRMFPVRVKWGALVLGIAIVAIPGYVLLVWQCGWENVTAGLQAYGSLRAFGMRNAPSLVSVWHQSLLALGCLALGQGITAWANRDQVRRQRLLVRTGVFAVIALGGVILEVARVYVVLFNWNYAGHDAYSYTVGFFSQMDHGARFILAFIHYIAGIFCINIVPLFLCLVLGGIALLGYLAARFRKGLRTTPAALICTVICFCGAGGMQLRYLMTCSYFATLNLFLPLVIYWIPLVLAVRMAPAQPKAFIQIWRRCGLFVISLIVWTISFLLYAYEFRDARWNPVRVEAACGTVDFPDTAENRALAAVVDRAKECSASYVVSLPYNGLQIWLGGRFPGPSWQGPLNNVLFHPSWESRFMSAILHNRVLFVERLNSGCPLLFPVLQYYWIDGPRYKRYFWESDFPGLNRIVHQQSQCLFQPPSHTPIYSLYLFEGIK